jgi:hypothetical protein
MKEKQKQKLLTANLSRKPFCRQKTSHYEGILKLIMLVLYLRTLSGKVIKLYTVYYNFCLQAGR